MFEWAATILSQGSTAGAIDVVAVRDSAGILSCSPFHVKLNKAAKKGDSCRIVKLTVNSKDVALSMKLGGAGEAFFVERTNHKICQNEATSSAESSMPFSPGNAPDGTPFHLSPFAFNSSAPSAVQNVVDQSKPGSNDGRRRQRSFSDGDIDGDYKYLLDEQNVMALSLCAPVSFHHQKETDSSPTARTDLNKGTDNISNFSAIVVTELTVVDRDQPVCHSDSLTVQLSVREISDDLPDCQAALPLPLSPPLSDNDGSGPLVTDYLATYIEQRDESIRNKSHPDGGKESNLRRIRALSDLSISEPWPETVNQEPRERDLNSPLSDDGNNLITFENKEENMNISGAQIITPTLPSNRAIDLETTDSEKVIINPPSWSWTWGALPVKSKSKSSSDLTKFVDSGTGILGPGSPQSAKSALMAERELNESSDTYAIPVGNIQSVAVEGSCGSEVTSIGGINEKNKIGDSLQCTVSLSNENNSVILNVEAAESGNKLDTSLKPDVTERILLSETISTTASVLLSETCGDDKHDSQVVVENIISGNDVANASTSSSVDVKISHSVEQQESSIDVNQTAINFEPPSVNNTEDIKTEGIQSNPLKINVISDPTSNDMWRWETSPMENETAITVKDKDIPNVSSDIIDNINIQHNELNPVNNTVTETVVEGITSTDGGIDIIPEDGPQSVPQGDQNTIERDVDGDTDQELDTLSLHDIPLDEISPEPAGGDFYDSDAESYVSLDEGEARKKSYPRGKRKYRYRRVLVPSQEQLQSLELHDGENEVSFELQNQMTKSGYALSVPPLRTQLFVWPQDAKIVIIDIEGAITAVSKGGKGWGIGGFLSVPRTAVHNGVAKLLTNIHKNGYRILYIAQSTSTALGTKEHLAKVAAGSDIKLPPGPVFQSPDSLIRAFGAARTDLFKAAALRGLKSLFPNGHNPYYACFGTRPCDMVAFSRCGVPEGRIFLVSPDTGEIRGVNRTFRSSYEQVNAVLHEMFPAVSDCQSRSPRSPLYLPSFSSFASPASISSKSISNSLPVIGLDRNINLSGVSTKSAESTCSLAEDDYSDFNFWKIPIMPLNI